MYQFDNPKAEEPKLWTPKGDCKGCSRWVDEKCHSNIKVCGCDNAELGRVYSKNNSFGFCKNCFHFIVKVGEDWKHYTRNYKCGYPYYEEICQAPDISENPDIKQFDKYIESLGQTNISARFKDEEAKIMNK